MLLSSDSQIPKLNIIQKIVLTLFGSCKIGYIKMAGWTDKLPYYAFKCKKHGIVYSTPHGFRENLLCPKCYLELELEKGLSEHELLQINEEFDFFLVGLGNTVNTITSVFNV